MYVPNSTHERLKNAKTHIIFKIIHRFSPGLLFYISPMKQVFASIIFFLYFKLYGI